MDPLPADGKEAAMNGNLFASLPPDLPEEFFDTLVTAGDLRIERIVSRGHASPADFWYDQDRHEFVLVLRGRAGISIEGRSETVVLSPGDYLVLEARLRHRVEWTDPDRETLWLAVHFSGEIEKR